MAKTTGPLFSLDSRGTVGKTLTYSYWRGVNYVRERVVPHNPDTDLQKAIRAIISQASVAWRDEETDEEMTTIDQDYKDAYDEVASGQAFSGFNAFIKDTVGKNDGSAFDPDTDIVFPTEPGDDEPATE